MATPPEPQTPPETPLREALPLATKLLFGAPGFAGAAMVIPISIHMTKFYADTVLVPLGVLGMAIAFARAFDAITDPLVGWLSDRTRTRMGRRRPWLLLGGPSCGLAFFLLFSPPEALGATGGATWFVVCYLLYFLCHTFYLIPHMALGAEISLDYHERSGLFAIREAFVVTGTLFAAVLPGLLTERFGERQALSMFAAIFGTALGLLYILLAARIRERAEFSRRPTNPFVPGVRRALRNRPFRILLGKSLLMGIPGTLTGTLLPFFTQYVVQPDNPARWLMLLLAGYFSSAFLFLPAWMVISRRVGKRNAALLAQTIGGFGALTVIFVGQGQTWLLLGLLVLNGSAFGAFSFLMPAMKADVIDHDELHTGRRREAQYTSLWAILPKFIQIPAAAIPIALLGSLGYVPNVEQSETVIRALRWMFAVVPAACFAAAFVVTLRFPIQQATHRKILDAIAAHARGEAAIDPVSGLWVPPPGQHAVPDETAWYLDHFSPRELRLVAAEGQARLTRRVSLLAAGSLALCVSLGFVLVGNVTGLDAKPGVPSVVGVMVSGLALCAFIFHLVRLRAARRFSAQGVPAEIVTRYRQSLQPGGIPPESDTDVGFS